MPDYVQPNYVQIKLGLTVYYQSDTLSLPFAFPQAKKILYLSNEKIIFEGGEKLYIKRVYLPFFLVFALFLTLVNTSQGIEVNPTKEQIDEVTKYGEANTGKIFKTELVAPAIFGNWPDFGGGLVKSKLINLAVMSAMMKRAKKNLTEETINEIMTEKNLTISYRGGADIYKIKLKQGMNLIEPKEMVKPDLGGKDPTKHAVFFVASFPFSKLDPNAKTSIVIVKDFGTNKYEVDFSNIK